MKVAFWENLRRGARETDDMAAISIMLSIHYHKKVILLDNGQESDSLERVFRGIHRFYYVKEDSNYIVHRHGMDQILNNLHITSDIQPLLAHSAVEVIQDYLYYVPESKVINHLAYDYELYHELTKIIRTYENISDFIMVRARNGNHLSTKHVLDEADLVMVELSQDFDELDEFFDNYSSIRHKAIFVFSQYKLNSISIYQIMNKYRIKKEQIVVITEHLPMSAACIGGNLVSYLKGNNNCSKGSEHYRCVRELRRAARMILRQERGDLLETIS